MIMPAVTVVRPAANRSWRTRNDAASAASAWGLQIQTANLERTCGLFAVMLGGWLHWNDLLLTLCGHGGRCVFDHYRGAVSSVSAPVVHTIVLHVYIYYLVYVICVCSVVGCAPARLCEWWDTLPSHVCVLTEGCAPSQPCGHEYT